LKWQDIVTSHHISTSDVRIEYYPTADFAEDSAHHMTSVMHERAKDELKQS